MSDKAVALYDPAHPTNTWRLRDGVAYEFPQGIWLAPGACAVLVGFDPVGDPAAAAAFQLAYGRPRDLFGPYRGRLDNDGETLELQRPGAPQPATAGGSAFVPYYTVDRVRYSPATPWPAAADGAGSSLQRIEPLGYGDDAASWRAAPPNPGEAPDLGRPVWVIEAVPAIASGMLRLRATGRGSGAVVLEGPSDLRLWTSLQSNAVENGVAEFWQPMPLEQGSQFFRLRFLPAL